jgi:hypothetical protein
MLPRIVHSLMQLTRLQIPEESVTNSKDMYPLKKYKRHEETSDFEAVMICKNYEGTTYCDSLII